MEQAGKDRWNEIWHVRSRLQMASRIRDLALFDVGLDSKLHLKLRHRLIHFRAVLLLQYA
jgi:hypothetical protein